MLISNETPFAAIAFGDLHRDGAEMSVICARARYNISEDGVLTLGNKQQTMLNDIYEGDPHQTPLLHVGDLIPYKPMVDVTLLGKAYAPGKQSERSWKAGISIGPHEAWLRVHGPRRWEPALKFLKPTWKLGPAKPVNNVPLDYRLAAGGHYVGDPQGKSNPRNPIGPGILHADWSRLGITLPAPQIESLEEPIADPFSCPEPQGFAPIPPFWQSREKFLGTRDEAWQRERKPQMPADLSYRFFQTAHPRLTIPKLHGDESVRLENLVPGVAVLVLRLPDIVPTARHQWLDGREVSARLRLDGIHFDFRDHEGRFTVDFTWRGWVAKCPDYYGADLGTASLAAASDLLTYDEDGLAEFVGAA